MRNILIIFVLAIALAGCATHGQYIDRMDAHTGLHIDTVVRSFGAPARVHEFDDGGTMYQWFYSSSGSMSFPIYAGGSYPASYFSVPYTSSCTTTFYANEMGFTTHYNWSGNSCTWYEPGPVELDDDDIAGTY